MEINGKWFIFMLSLFGFSSASSASEITVTETLLDQAPSAGWVKLGFNVTNNSTLRIDAFAIGNNNDVSGAGTPEGSGWYGYAIFRDEDNTWPTTYGETEQSSPPVNLSSGDLEGYNGAFFYYTDTPSSALMPGASLFVTGETGWLDSSFVAFAKNSEGNIVRFTGETTVVPLPAAAWLFLTGIAGLWGFSKRKGVA